MGKRQGVQEGHTVGGIEDGFDELDGLRRAKGRALRALHDASGTGVASHQVDVFILEPGTDRFTRCPITIDSCARETPQMVEVAPSHAAACLFAGDTAPEARDRVSP